MACALIFIRQNLNRSRQIVASKRTFKVFMKRKFLPQFFDCIRKISQNHNITSFIEFLLFNCLTLGDLFDVKVTQPVTSLCIITFQKNFIDLKSTQNITLKYLGLYLN